MAGFSVVYLHGFASSPQSAKGVFFRDYFASRGVRFVAPDLNLPSFRGLTLTRAVQAAEEASAGLQQVCVIGSSLGGYAAALWAAQREAEGRPLRAGMLIAPAFQAHRLWSDRLSPEAMAAWRRTGELSLRAPNGQWLYGPEYAALDFRIYEDALVWGALALPLSAPLLIFHGEKDETVPIGRSLEFARGRPGVTLHSFAGEAHGLVDRSAEMAERTFAFFAKPANVGRQ